MNKVILAGRLTTTPELSTTSSGVEFLRFSIAVNKAYKKDDEQQKADFINCVAWRKTAVFISSYFKKGDGINIEGSIQTGNYKAKDGSTKYTTDVLIEKVKFPLSRKSDTNVSYSNDSQPQEAAPTTDFADLPVDEDLPF